jgi:hypothetical protein
MDFDAISYSTSFQGFIQENGTIVSTRPWAQPSADGYYSAITWDMENDPQEQEIVMLDGKASPVNCFFAIRDSSLKERVYEIKKVSIDSEGVVTIDAFYHPTNANGFSLLGVNWTTYETDANWVIEL